MYKKWLMAVFVFVLCISMNGTLKAQNVFKVGVITSLSGELGNGGDVTKKGYDLWAHAINSQGGIEIGGNKYPVRLIYADAQSDPTSATIEAERLAIEHNVDFILGPFSSGITLAVAPIVEKYKIPMITGTAESPLICKRKYKYIFGTIPPVNFFGPTSIEHLSTLMPRPKTIVIIGSNDPFSRTAAESYRASAMNMGLTIDFYGIISAGQDLTPIMSAILTKHPDFIAYVGHNEELIGLVEVLNKINLTPKILFMHYGITEHSFIERLGNKADECFGSTVWTAQMNIQGDLLWKTPQAYDSEYRNTYKMPSDYTAAACSASGIAFQAALQKIQATPPLDETEKNALIKTLEEINIKTFYGHINFASEGNFYHANTGLKPLTVQIQDRKVVVVAPEEFAEAKPIYPMTPWKNR